MPEEIAQRGGLTDSPKEADLVRKWKIVLFIVLAVYSLLIALSPHSLIYDEGYYISIAKELSRLGLSNQFIAEMDAPTGILYGLVHWAASIVTNFRPPLIRLVNLAFASGCCFFLAKIIQITTGDTKTAVSDVRCIATPVAWLAAPMSGVVICLALTEMSAIFFSLLGSLAVISSVANPRNGRIPIGGLLLGGLAYGLSIWGRQNFIILPIMSILLLLPLTLNRLTSYLLILALSMPFFFAPALIWGGLVPPAVGFVEKGILPSSFIFSLYHVSATLLFVCPGIYKKLNKRKAFACLGISSLSIALFPNLIKVPSEFFVRQTFGETGVAAVGILFSLIMLTFSFATVSVLLELSAQAVRNRFTDFFLASSFLLLASNIKITHQFSSRYVTLALPYVLLAVFISDRRQVNLGAGRLLLLSASILASLFFVVNYYWD